jgi:hypothetical protein
MSHDYQGPDTAFIGVPQSFRQAGPKPGPLVVADMPS